MVAPVYNSGLRDVIVDMPSTAGWAALGGGQAGLVAPESDFFIQGSNCISKSAWQAAERGIIYTTTAQTRNAGEAVWVWVYYWANAALAEQALGGMQVLLGSSSTAYEKFFVAGSDTLQYGGWYIVPVDPTVTPDAVIGAPNNDLASFGVLINVPAAGPSKGQPLGIDAIRIGRDFTVTGGDAINGYANFIGAASFDNQQQNRFGQIFRRDGSFFMQGRLLLGTGTLATTAVDFRDQNKTLFILNTEKVQPTFNEIAIANTNSNLSFQAVTIQSLSTVSRGRWTTTNNPTVNMNSCTFVDMDTFTFASNTQVTNSTFRRCGKIIHNLAILLDNSFENPTIAVDDSVIDWNPQTNTDGYLDGSTFIKGDNAHHAIAFIDGGITNRQVTLRNMNFVGFNAADGQNDSTFLIDKPLGDITINLINCTGNVSIKTIGNILGVTVQQDPVTTRIEVLDSTTNLPIQGARVYVVAAAGGNIPEGTVIINDLTNTQGVVTDSRTLGQSQPIIGRVRYSSGTGPFYKTSNVTGVIDAAQGFNTTILLIKDE